ncbi:MAG: ChbG/HpnK family deacetylase [Phycicoccus sp.]
MSGVDDRPRRLLLNVDDIGIRPGAVEAAVGTMVEFRAQIELVLDRVRPTHLDWHVLLDGGREDIFDLTLTLADEYRLGIRAWSGRSRSMLVAAGRPVQDHPFLDSFAISLEDRERHLLAQLRALLPGTTEWALHPASAASYDRGAEVRLSDYRFLMSDKTRQVIDEENVLVVGSDTGSREQHGS